MSVSMEMDQAAITVLIECTEESFTGDVKDQFGEENVSESSNFIGGVSIAVFLVATAKSLQPILKSVLDFLAKRKGRYDDATIVYDGKKINLKGYSADEAEKLLNNSVFDNLRK